MDRDLVEQAQRGDREAFGILARTRADRLFAIGQRILRDVDRAEDAMQQALVIAWRELPRLRDPDRFDAWLIRLLGWRPDGQFDSRRILEAAARSLCFHCASPGQATARPG